MATTLLRGSVRRAGDVIRIAVQLLDHHAGRQIWADRYDVTAGNLFAVQDQIAERIASALAIGVDRTRLEAAQRTPLSSLETYDCWLRGFDCLQRGTVEADAEARRFFERALESDPAYARAYAGLSLSHFNEWSCQAWQKWDETERLAYDYAKRAARARRQRRHRAGGARPHSPVSPALRRGGVSRRTRAQAESERHRRARARRLVPRLSR